MRSLLLVFVEAARVYVLRAVLSCVAEVCAVALAAVPSLASA
jgi:hypothetical protein